MPASVPSWLYRAVRGTLAASILCTTSPAAFALQDPPTEGEPPAAAEETQLPGIPGPTHGELGKIAGIDVPEGYQFLDATVLRFPANKSLEGLQIPQVPRHLLTFQARYSNPRRLTVSFQGRAGGSQFDDDQNQFRLDSYFTLDAFASRSLGHGVEVFGAFENLTGQRYDIGRTPIRTLGPPLLARVGLRFTFGGR